MRFFGDRQTGKTAVATYMILNQQGQNVICVYVGGSRNRRALILWWAYYLDAFSSYPLCTWLPSVYRSPMGCRRVSRSLKNGTAMVHRQARSDLGRSTAETHSVCASTGAPY
ncbi:hypothetical protein HAX54_003302 [Datura stramonium]|uniref:Uncharacterized protein n=1 Tax=Datura stramonium TaxID=4076 RepID=A0ABS8T547_DATST|nr:hypothetical protein [Datura stramonium]